MVDDKREPERIEPPARIEPKPRAAQIELLPQPARIDSQAQTARIEPQSPQPAGIDPRPERMGQQPQAVRIERRPQPERMESQPQPVGIDPPLEPIDPQPQRPAPQLRLRPPRRIPKFRRRAEARPDEVLDAALDLFIEKGFAATRVEDIARRAELSKGAVYLYFPSKEAIIEALVRRALVPVASNAAAFVSSFDGDPRVAISTVMQMLGAAMANPRTMAIPKLVVREVVNFPELAQMYRRELLDRAIPMLEALLRRGIAGGYLRPVDPGLTVRTIVGAFIAHLMLAEVFGIVPEGGLQLDRLVENHLLILFDGLARNPGAQA